MRTIRDLTEARLSSRSCVTVGVFDGLHRGHQRLIAALVASARARRNCAVLITFDPHPTAVLGYASPPLLTTIEERAELLGASGLDLFVVLPFTPALASISASDFVALLERHLHLLELWGGTDLALGRAREGDLPFLQRLGAERGFSVHVVEPLVWEGAVVNSSRVRAALAAGDIRQATGCLGRPYALGGRIVTPLDRGRFAFAPAAQRLVPARGRYAGALRAGRGVAYPATLDVLADAVAVELAAAHAVEPPPVGAQVSLEFTARL